MFLDSKFFDKDSKLHTAIRMDLLNIANDVLKDLEDKGTKITPAFIILTGSLTGLNWDDASDIDLHIGIDFSEFPGDKINLYKNLLAYYARNFNTNNFTLKGRKVEIYFQDAREKHESPGIFDLKHDLWIKIPENTKREFDSQVKKGAQTILGEVDVLVFEYDNTPKDRGVIKSFLDRINAFFKRITEMRKMSLQHDGLYGFGNLVFKELRRNEALEKLSNLRKQAQEDWYDVGEGMSKAKGFIHLIKGV